MQSIVVIPYRRFGTTNRSHLQGSEIQEEKKITTIRCGISQKSADLKSLHFHN